MRISRTFAALAIIGIAQHTKADYVVWDDDDSSSSYSYDYVAYS